RPMAETTGPRALPHRRGHLRGSGRPLSRHGLRRLLGRRCLWRCPRDEGASALTPVSPAFVPFLGGEDVRPYGADVHAAHQVEGGRYTAYAYEAAAWGRCHEAPSSSGGGSV